MSDNTIKVESIKVAINGITLELSVDDAKRLQAELAGALGVNQQPIWVMPYQPYIPPAMPYYGEPYRIVYSGTTFMPNES
jgi:hypothetical protein